MNLLNGEPDAWKHARPVRREGEGNMPFNVTCTPNGQRRIGPCISQVMRLHSTLRDVTPSQDDLTITKRLKTTGEEIVGIPVLDHVIIGNDTYLSFVDDGYWPS